MRELQQWETDPWRLKAIAGVVNCQRRQEAAKKGDSCVFCVSAGDVLRVMEAAAAFGPVEP